MKIKSLPIEERPREKALRQGIDTLSNEELLAIILGSGNKNMNVIELSTSVLSSTGGLKGLLTSSYYALIKINGLNKAKSLVICAISELYKRYPYPIPKFKHNPNLDLEKYQKLVSFDSQEKLFIIILNKLGNVLEEKELYRGSSSGIHVTIRDIFKEVFLVNGYSFYLIHTHPNTFPLPSKDDINATLLIKEKCRKIGLKLVDHYIVSSNGISSLNDYC